MSLSDRLGIFRKQVGLTQAEFAESLGLSLTAYKNYEKGTREPPASVLILLCTIYDATPAWLLKGETSENVAKALDVAKTEACFRYLDVFKKDQKLQLDRHQQAKAFNVIFQNIDGALEEGALDRLVLASINS